MNLIQTLQGIASQMPSRWPSKMLVAEVISYHPLTIGIPARTLERRRGDTVSELEEIHSGLRCGAFKWKYY